MRKSNRGCLPLVVAFVQLFVWGLQPKAQDPSLTPMLQNCPDKEVLETLSTYDQRRVLLSTTCQTDEGYDPIDQGASPETGLGAWVEDDSANALQAVLELIGTAGAAVGPWLLVP